MYVYFFRDSENYLYFLPVFLPLPGVIPFALSSSETAFSEAKYNNQVVDIIIREAKYKLLASMNSNNKIAQESRGTYEDTLHTAVVRCIS